MRKALSVALVSLLASVSLLGATKTPANAEMRLVCASGSTCFSRSSSALPFVSFSQSIPRNVCHNIADGTTWVDNNPGPVQWKVATFACGGTGIIGTIYSNTEGSVMSGIKSTWRTSTP